jgi:hypothetical protein
MGILDSFPPSIIAFLTWLILWMAACFMILIISLGVGKLLGEFIEGIIGHVR